MACGSSFDEENPIKDRLREERSAKKHLDAAKKIADFLQKKLDGSCVSVTHAPNVNCQVKRVRVAVNGLNLSVQHRGFNISANCQDAVSLSIAFQDWLATDMTHVTKVEFGAN